MSMFRLLKRFLQACTDCSSLQLGRSNARAGLQSFRELGVSFLGAKSNECPEDILDNGGFRLRKMKDEG